jgi:uncharacterized membrane protein YeaQ/YmgE (transglycosylase-associated protein family)
MDFTKTAGILIQIAISALVGFIYFKTSKKTLLGNLWGAIIVGVIGGVLVSLGLTQINKWLSFFTVDFVSTVFGALILLWVFAKLSTH